MKHKYLLGLAAGLLLAAGSFAAPFQGVQLDKSSITFRYKQMGVAMDGKFAKFQSTLQLDTAKPELARASQHAAAVDEHREAECFAVLERKYLARELRGPVK